MEAIRNSAVYTAVVTSLMVAVGYLYLGVGGLTGGVPEGVPGFAPFVYLLAFVALVAGVVVAYKGIVPVSVGAFGGGGLMSLFLVLYFELNVFGFVVGRSHEGGVVGGFVEHLAGSPLAFILTLSQAACAGIFLLILVFEMSDVEYSVRGEPAH